MRPFAGLHAPKFVAPLQEGTFILNLPDNNLSSATARLQSARLKQWHQQGEALLTIENARSFLNATGLVLFAPRPQVAAPAPSFVEAVLGTTTPAPTLVETAQARGLLARLVAEGLAVPLNLLGIGSVIGQAGDAPDFIVSAQIFSYVFTLRGDKAWKQPPQGTGPAKFSNLAIAAHEALTERGPLSAYDLATQLGKEVTEGAVLRALGELWMHLRVLPLPQTDDRPTVWELASTRLMKQIKAGANAGLPTALSTLISLYLGQAIVASEDEIESFLSPLAARSRVRDVLHALLSARQLDTVAIEGKTVLHVAGDVPAFLSEESPVEVAATLAEQENASVDAATEEHEAAEPFAEESSTVLVEAADSVPRIAKFVPRNKPAGKDLAKAKPAKLARKPFSEAHKPFDKDRKPFGDKKPFRPRDSDGRPAGRPPFAKKSFPPRSDETRPKFEWREGGGSRPERERRPFVKREGSDLRPPRKPFDRGGDRPAARKFADRSGDSRPARRSFDRGDRSAPRTPFERSGDSRPPRKAFSRSPEDRPFRKPFDRGGDRSGPRKFAERPSEGRPPRKPFDRSGDKPAVRKPFNRSAEDRPGAKRFERSGDSRPPRKPFNRGGDRQPARKPFGGTSRFRPRDESSSQGERRGGFGKKPFSGSRGKSPDSKPFGSKPFAGKPRGEGTGPGRPSGGGGGKKFGGKSFGGAKNAFGRPSPGRGPKPRRGSPES